MKTAVAFVGLALAVAAQTPPAGYLEAVKRHQAGDLTGAVEAYRAYLETDPGRPEALSNLGAALASLGRYDDAIAAYDQALSQTADHPGIRRNRALALYKSGRTSDAAAELDALREAQSEDVGLAILSADCRVQLGDDAGAVAVLEPFASRHGDDKALAYLLGAALIRQGRLDDGRRLVAPLLVEGSAEAHLIMGLTYVQATEFTKARAEFEQAIALKPSLLGVHSYLGKTLLELNERAAADQAFQAELAGNAIDFDANFYRGVLLREDGEPEQALPYLQAAHRLRPQAVEAGYQVALSQLALKRYEAARETLEKLVAEAPGFTAAHVSLASAYYRLGRMKDAARHQEIVRGAQR